MGPRRGGGDDRTSANRGDRGVRVRDAASASPLAPLGPISARRSTPEKEKKGTERVPPPAGVRRHGGRVTGGRGRRVASGRPVEDVAKTAMGATRRGVLRTEPWSSPLACVRVACGACKLLYTRVCVGDVLRGVRRPTDPYVLVCARGTGTGDGCRACRGSVHVLLAFEMGEEAGAVTRREARVWPRP